MTVEITNAGALRAPGLINITEIDGIPVAANVSTIKFTNTSVTNYDPATGSVDVTTGVGGGGDVSSNTGVSVDGEAVLFSGTGGKTIKRSTLTGMLKSAAGVQQVATPNTDYAPATTGTSILKALSGGFTDAAAGTDYLAPPSGSSILMANSGGALANAVAGTHYLAPNGNGSLLTNMTKSQVGLGNVDNTSDVNKPVSTAQQAALDLKAPKASPAFTGDINSLMLGTENFTIDASTNPRTITLGVFRINHKAGVAGTRPITLDIDCGGFGDTHAIAVNYRANGAQNGDENHIYEVLVDTTGTTGGNVQGLSVNKIGAGAVKVVAVEANSGVHVIEQNIGLDQAADTNFIYANGVYTDASAYFNNGTDIQFFVSNEDYVYFGNGIQFTSIDVDLLIPADDGGVIPTFEYSTGTQPNDWTAFSPVDGTNGFRQSGSITFGELTGWVVRSVNGVPNKFWLRIRRTNATAITPPTERTIHIIVSERFYWDALGLLDISKLEIRNLSTYSSVANAIEGGLPVGAVFKKADGTLMIV